MAQLTKKQAIGMATALVVVFGFTSFSGLIFGKGQSSTKDNTAASAAVTAAPNVNTETGASLSVSDMALGSGAAVKAGDTVSVNYIGTLSDGTQFDSSYDRGAPITFTVGSNQVIQGFDRGVVGMKVGGKRRIVVPPSLGYGSQAVGPISANSTLTFDVELEKIAN